MTAMPSSWHHLRHVVPNVLHLGVVGLPFVNPGPIGGDPTLLGDGVAALSPEEEQELYVRWWQLCTFMPVTHFLKPPTFYNLEEVRKMKSKEKKT